MFPRNEDRWPHVGIDRARREHVHGEAAHAETSRRENLIALPGKYLHAALVGT